MAFDMAEPNPEQKVTAAAWDEHALYYMVLVKNYPKKK